MISKVTLKRYTKVTNESMYWKFALLLVRAPRIVTQPKESKYVVQILQLLLIKVPLIVVRIKEQKICFLNVTVLFVRVPIVMILL